jgi:hypothetical protein
MITIQKYFNTEKENYTPSVGDFQNVINAINMKEGMRPTVSTYVSSFETSFSKRVQSHYFKYSFSLLSMAAAFVIFIYNKETIAPTENTNQVAMSQTSKKQMQIDNTLLAIDNIKSFDAQ